MSVAAYACAASFASAAWAGSHSWDVNEIFSNADGTIQFIELHEPTGADGETNIGDLFLASDSTGAIFTFPDNIKGPTGYKHMLLGTKAFAALPGAPQPDYIIPDGFFDPGGDTISYHVFDTFCFEPGDLPMDCDTSLRRAAVIRLFANGANVTGRNSPTNYSGETGSINICPQEGAEPLDTAIGAAGEAESLAASPFDFASVAPVLGGGFGGDQGGAAGTFDVAFDNYDPVTPYPAAHLEPTFPFVAEAATDFVLPGDDGLTCTLDFLVFGAQVSASTPACFDSVMITIYHDISAGEPDGVDPLCESYSFGPAGRPDPAALPAAGHIECFAGAIVCEMNVPMDNLWFGHSSFGFFEWEIQLSDLSDVMPCSLQKNHVYWIAVAPVMPWENCGQVFFHLNESATFGHPDVQIFSYLEVDRWRDAESENWPGGDLSIFMGFNNDPALPCVDLNDDNTVGPADLAIILGNWGPVPPGDPIADLNNDSIVGPADLAIILGNWGPCA